MYSVLPRSNRTNFSFQNENVFQPTLLPKSQQFERSPRKRPTNAYAARYLNQDRYVPPPVNISNSVSRDRIQRERRAHTMAPLTRITGPISTPRAKMFASIPAPAANNPQYDRDITDDDAPIIIKVRYDPRTDVRPSEHFVRTALGQQIRNHKIKQQPIIMNYSRENFSTQIPKTISHSRVARQTAQPCLQPKSIPRPVIKQQQVVQPLKVPQSTTEFHRSNAMATQRTTANLNTQQSLATRTSANSASDNVFHPPAVKDIPELSRENLLSMLNQIPDLQGRQFKIEYALSGAPESYPIPVEHLSNNDNSFPEPVYIDTLPSNVIQHVKNSNNPAITAALEASIQHEQNPPARSTLNIQSNYSAKTSGQVQESRPVSSSSSDSSSSSSGDTSDSDSTEVSSSESEESEEIVSTGLANNLPFVGSIPSAQYQYR